MSTVLITGASRGIGAEFARQYAAAGWDVIATAREPKSSKELQSMVASGARNIKLFALNVANESSVQALADDLDGQPIDLLINNAAIYPREGTRVGALDYDSWQETFETNFFGAMRLTEALVENVAASERKQIAAISSTMSSLRAASGGGSIEQSGFSYQYRTTKTALNMAMVILSKEVQPQGISVVLLCPGWVKTDMGGANAAITAEVSVSGMRKVLSGDPMAISGKFLGYDGAVRPW